MGLTDRSLDDGTRWSDLSISEIAGHLRVSHTSVSRDYAEWSKKENRPVSRTYIRYNCFCEVMVDFLSSCHNLAPPEHQTANSSALIEVEAHLVHLISSIKLLLMFLMIVVFRKGVLIFTHLVSECWFTLWGKCIHIEICCLFVTWLYLFVFWTLVVFFYFFSPCDIRLINRLILFVCFLAAGNAFCQAALLHLQIQSKHDAATNFIDAGNAFKKADPQGLFLLYFTFYI